MFLFIGQLFVILVLIGTVFVIIKEMFHDRIILKLSVSDYSLISDSVWFWSASGASVLGLKTWVWFATHWTGVASCDFSARERQLVSIDRSSNCCSWFENRCLSLIKKFILRCGDCLKLNWDSCITSLTKFASKTFGAVTRSVELLSSEATLYKSTIWLFMD